MNAQQRRPADPALEELRSLTDRLRQRAAQGRVRRQARAVRGPQRELPLRLTPLPPLRAPPVPHHWSDGRDDEQSAA